MPLGIVLPSLNSPSLKLYNLVFDLHFSDEKLYWKKSVIVELGESQPGTPITWLCLALP
jgi:hypothetical protein